MRYNVACVCEYLGTNYVGWQRQKKGCSIQGLIESVLSDIYAEDIKITGSGRTDAGVHAYSQVFNFKSDKYRSNDSVIRALNSKLPNDISVYGAKQVHIDFHAWLHPVAKTYEYKIINQPYPPALYEDRALWVRNKVDVEELNTVLQYVVGEHDFTSFCVTKTKKDNTIRCVNYVKAYKTESGISILINANGFLHNMVRVIVGSALDIIRNERPHNDMHKMLLAKDRRVAGKTAPAHGLYQKEIFYKEGIAGLAGITGCECFNSDKA